MCVRGWVIGWAMVVKGIGVSEMEFQSFALFKLSVYRNRKACNFNQLRVSKLKLKTFCVVLIYNFLKISNQKCYLLTLIITNYQVLKTLCLV